MAIFVPLLVCVLGVTGALWYIFRKYIKEYFSNQGKYGEDSRPLLPASGVELAATNKQSMKDIAWSNVLTLFVNGNAIYLTNPDPSELLVSFIRDKIGLKGTKLGCEEGGCGACTVVLTKPDGIYSVNSCLRPLCANDGMSITTVEGIGSVNTSLSEEQQRLVANNGTQCGYCTPGWVTNMYALNESNGIQGKTVTRKEIDAYLDGNICRCTGYRPILQAFQSFAEGDSESSCCSSKSSCGNDNAGKVHPCVQYNCSAEKQQKCASNGHDVENCEGPCADIEGMGNKSQGAPKKSGCGTMSKPLGRKKLEKDLALVRAYTPQPLLFFNPVTGQRWIRPVTLQQLCTVLREIAPTPEQAQYVQLVGGNTSIGVTKYLNGTSPYNSADKYSTFIDVNQIQEMVNVNYNDTSKELTVGAATSISTLIGLLNEHATPVPSNSQHQHNSSVSGNVDATESATGRPVNHHSVFSVTANHLSKIANTQVRNAGSWAGNLMVFLKYPTFPSDAVLALATANAKLLVSNQYGEISTIDMVTFLSYSLASFRSAGLMLVGLTLSEVPQVSGARLHMSSQSERTEFLTETFKVAQRIRNAHAHVNAGFQFELEQPRLTLRSNGASSGPPVCRGARVVFGGVSAKTFVAYRCQNALINAPITAQTLQQALAALQIDLIAVGKNEDSTLVSQQYRESVMQSCLYRALLRCYPVFALPSNLLSAVLPWNIPVSRGHELFVPPHGKDAKENVQPVGLPVRKLEAKIQSTGEATYPSDEALPPQGLHGAIVFSTACAKKLTVLDASAALSLPGVVAVLTAADIPGENAGNGSKFMFVPVGETVECVGAQLGVVVATSEAVANQAAALVFQAYEGDAAPITNLKQAIAAQSFFPNKGVVTQGQDIDQALAASERRVAGRISTGGQYHFYMEAQTAVACTVDGDNINVVCGSQYPIAYQAQIATVLGLPANKVVVDCPRTGGAFGGKIMRGIPVACAAALCSKKLNRPVRIFNTRTADMAQVSGREDWMAEYEIGFNSNGTVTALKYNFFVNAGIDGSDTGGSTYMGMYWADNAYFFPNYSATATVCYSNTPARTSMRCPGVVNTSLCTEMVIERVAKETGLAVASVQQANFIQDGELAICGQVITDCTLPTVWGTLMQRSRYNERLANVNTYNSRSLWRKRGIAVSPVKYGMGWAGYAAGIQLGVNQSDGTVTLSHSGCEIGQGINTKVAQAVAMALGIDLNLIRVVYTATNRVANGGCTGGSATSEVTVQAALNACQTLNTRLSPFWPAAGARRGLGSKHTTSDWVALLKSLPYDVSLNVEGWFSPNENPNGQFFQYFVYAACLTEVELDVLSGEVHVLASEMVYDCGQSLNPAVDIGQIEGAVVMALGWFLTERSEYDTATGELLTNGTWEYKPPLAQDIPASLSVTLLRNKYNESGVLGSKAVGEPPYVAANSVYFAVKQAVSSARNDAGAGNQHFFLDVPCTVDIRQTASLVNPSRFVMPY